MHQFPFTKCIMFVFYRKFVSDPTNPSIYLVRYVCSFLLSLSIYFLPSWVRYGVHVLSLRSFYYSFDYHLCLRLIVYVLHRQRHMHTNRQEYCFELDFFVCWLSVFQILVSCHQIFLVISYLIVAVVFRFEFIEKFFNFLLQAFSGSNKF